MDMRWFVIMLASLQLSGCGCRDLATTTGTPEPPSVSPERSVAPSPPPEDADTPTLRPDVPEIEDGRPDTTDDAPPRFAPNQRYGWPKDFLLPLIIEIEVPDVPEEIRGPSPPIAQVPQ